MLPLPIQLKLYQGITIITTTTGTLKKLWQNTEHWGLLLGYFFRSQQQQMQLLQQLHQQQHQTLPAASAAIKSTAAKLSGTLTRNRKKRFHNNNKTPPSSLNYNNKSSLRTRVMATIANTMADLMKYLIVLTYFLFLVGFYCNFLKR